MVKALNDYSLVKIIDNTNPDELAGYARGYTENSELVDPTEAVIISSEKFLAGVTVQFTNYWSSSYNGQTFITNKSVFLVEDKLARAGVIVRKDFTEQISNGFNFRGQDFFMVVASNMPEIKKGNIIIAKSHTAIRFNRNKKEYFFVNPSSILVVCDDEIKAGPCYLLEPKNSGAIFKHAVFEIDIEGIKYSIVPEELLLGYDDAEILSDNLSAMF